MKGMKGVAQMHAVMKRALALFCALAICLGCGSALAEFSPRYTALMKEEGITLTLSGNLESMTTVGQDTLTSLNDWLSRCEYTLTAGKDSLIGIRMDDETVFSIATQRKGGYILTSFTPSNTAYLTTDEQGDMLSAALGAQTDIPDFSRFPSAYQSVVPKLYDILGKIKEPKAVKERTSIKYASASQSYMNYVLTDGEMNEHWEEILSVILPALSDIMTEQPALYVKTRDTLRALTFQGECRFKRFLDKDGEDMGMQFTAQAEKDGDLRKVTLFGGYTDHKGGYFSLNLPAVTGKNTLKITLAAQETLKNNKGTLTLEGTYSRRLNDSNVEATLDGTLKNTLSDDSEKWSGKVTVNQTENKVKTVWTLTPDLEFTAEGLKGTVTINEKQGSKNILKANVHVSLSPMQEIEFAQAGSALDLREVPQNRIYEAALDELNPLSELLVQLIGDLSEEDQAHLLHDLRTDSWMNGPAMDAE